MNKDFILQKARYWLSCEQEGINIYTNQEFLTWINFSKEHKKIFEEEKSFRNSFNVALSQSSKNELINQVEAELKREKVVSKNIKVIASLAACVLLIFFSSMFFKKEKQYTQTIHSKNKIIHNILLPDDSKLTLDAKTNMELVYSKNKREILLKEGKAIFDVSSNKKRPFYVKSNSILVQVVGTKFEVNKLKDHTKISVLEGMVMIKQDSNDKARHITVLAKGDVLNISKFGKIKSLEKVSLEKIGKWTNEKLIFDNTPLNEVLKVFSKYLQKNVFLNINDPENYPITGEFDVYDFNEFLKLLPIIYPLYIEKNQENIKISKKI